MKKLKSTYNYFSVPMHTKLSRKLLVVSKSKQKCLWIGIKVKIIYSSIFILFRTLRIHLGIGNISFD